MSINKDQYDKLNELEKQQYIPINYTVKIENDNVVKIPSLFILNSYPNINILKKDTISENEYKILNESFKSLFELNDTNSGYNANFYSQHVKDITHTKKYIKEEKEKEKNINERQQILKKEEVKKKDIISRNEYLHDIVYNDKVLYQIYTTEKVQGRYGMKDEPTSYIKKSVYDSILQQDTINKDQFDILKETDKTNYVQNPITYNYDKLTI